MPFARKINFALSALALALAAMPAARAADPAPRAVKVSYVTTEDSPYGKGVTRFAELVASKT